MDHRVNIGRVHLTVYQLQYSGPLTRMGLRLRELAQLCMGKLDCIGSPWLLMCVIFWWVFCIWAFTYCYYVLYRALGTMGPGNRGPFNRGQQPWTHTAHCTSPLHMADLDWGKGLAIYPRLGLTYPIHSTHMWAQLRKTVTTAGGYHMDILCKASLTGFQRVLA